MKVGVPKGEASEKFRVSGGLHGAVWASTSWCCMRHEVLVQRGAGIGSSLPDADFRPPAPS